MRLSLSAPSVLFPSVRKWLFSDTNKLSRTFYLPDTGRQGYLPGRCISPRQSGNQLQNENKKSAPAKTMFNAANGGTFWIHPGPRW